MLSPLQVEILETIARSPEDYVDVGVTPDRKPADRWHELSALRGSGYVGIDGRGYAYITEAGRTALIDAQQQLAQAAKQIADQRAADDRKQKLENRKQRSEWVRFFLGLVLGWLLGALTPVDLLNLGKRLIQWINSIFK